MHEPLLTAEEIETFLRSEFPQMYVAGDVFTIEQIGRGTARMALDPLDRHLRPGNTISGPTLFTLADVTAYVATLAHVGAKALALTTSLNINFLARAERGRLVCDGELLKLGRRLAICDLRMSDREGTLIAQATATYSIPTR